MGWNTVSEDAGKPMKAYHAELAQLPVSGGLWQWHPTPVPLPGKSHGRRSLVGCSPWGREESDTTERLHFHFSLSCIEGNGKNGNPLQCSCLENPRDAGAWWAAVYGVTQSQTQLKQLSSRSSSSMGPVDLWAEQSTLQPVYWGISHWGLTMKWIFQ